MNMQLLGMPQYLSITYSLSINIGQQIRKSCIVISNYKPNKPKEKGKANTQKNLCQENNNKNTLLKYEKHAS